MGLGEIYYDAGYVQGFDDACAIYTQAALDMARTLADMAAVLNADRVLARRQALRLRWRVEHPRPELVQALDRLDYRAWKHPAKNLRTGRPDWSYFSVPLHPVVVRMLRDTWVMPLAGPVGRLP